MLACVRAVKGRSRKARLITETYLVPQSVNMYIKARSGTHFVCSVSFGTPPNLVGFQPRPPAPSQTCVYYLRSPCSFVIL